MPIPKALLLSFILMLFLNGKPFTIIKDCDYLTIELETSKIQDSNNLFTATIKANGGKAPYNYVFLDKDGNLLSFDHSQKEFKNIKQGNYRCIVVDSQDCKKELYVDIK